MLPSLGQLISVTYPDGRIVTYEYDAAGNRVHVTDDGVVTNYTTNNMDQYTQVGNITYTFDADGNMTGQTNATGTTTYVFDVENRLTDVTEPDGDTWIYAYDALDNRISATQNGIVTNYVHDPIGFVDMVAEYDIGNSLIARYHHGLGLVSRIDVNDNPTYYGFDGTGNTRQMTEASGVVINSYNYDPFGISLQRSETVANAFRYSGRLGIMDEDNNLLYLRARHYDSSLGRFMSEDPIDSNLVDNQYLYAMNNPVIYVDPNGEAAIGSKNIGSARKARRVGKAYQDTIKDYVDGVVDSASGKNSEEKSRERNNRMRKRMVKAGLPNWAGGLVDKLFPPYEPPIEDNPVSPYDPPISPYREKEDEENTDVPESLDPNEKTAPLGTGPQHAIVAEENLQYTIYFENVITATAPAQEVFVTDFLDIDLDHFTFQPTEFAFGDVIVAVPEGVSNYATQVTIPDYRASVNTTWLVNMSVAIDYDSGELLWTFRTLDSLTDDLPYDALAGFLPPEDGTGQGQGHVSFTILPKANSPNGTVITNEASIVFDTNDPIVTNQVFNTIGEPSTIYLPIILR